MRLAVYTAFSLLVCGAAASAHAQILDDTGFVPKRSDTRLRFHAIDLGGRAGVRETMGTLGVSRTVGMSTWNKAPLSFAVGARIDAGGAKWPEAWRFGQRVAATGDVRWHARSRTWYGLARLAVGATQAGGRFAFGVEGSIGAAFSFAELDDDPTEHLPRFWLSPELGVALAPTDAARTAPFARAVVTMSF